LTENLTLREKSLELQNHIDSSKKVVVDHVQAALTSKLDELQLFVSQLSSLANSTNKPLPDYPQQQTALKAFKRNFRTPVELLEEQDGFLPTIREDKHWPRKTLEYVDYIFGTGVAILTRGQGCRYRCVPDRDRFHRIARYWATTNSALCQPRAHYVYPN
jgi:hypothetical protein